MAGGAAAPATAADIGAAILQGVELLQQQLKDVEGAYREGTRAVAPRRAQVSGPVDRVSAFPYRLKVTHG